MAAPSTDSRPRLRSTGRSPALPASADPVRKNTHGGHLPGHELCCRQLTPRQWRVPEPHAVSTPIPWPHGRPAAVVGMPGWPQIPGLEIDCDGLYSLPAVCALCTACSPWLLQVPSCRVIRGSLRSIPDSSRARTPIPACSPPSLGFCSRWMGQQTGPWVSSCSPQARPWPFRCSILARGHCWADTAPMSSPDWPLTGSLALSSALESPVPASLGLDSGCMHWSGKSNHPLLTTSSDA